MTRSARHNNARLRAFLDQFGFDYEFKSSTDAYKAGEFDATLLKMLARYDAVMKIMLPTLREERAATYSPFLPIHPKTRVVMQVPIDEVDVAAGTITWRDPDTGERFVTPVTGGHVKLQWKPDWAMRWVALGIDYEMAGKDLIDSVKVSSAIARALGGTPPEGFNYELFLDDQGPEDLEVEGQRPDHRRVADLCRPESLSLFMYSRPREAKKLHFDVIPRAVDEYLSPVSFALLLNLVGVANASTKEQLWAYFAKYLPEATPENEPVLDRLMGHALNYYEDFVKPSKSYRLPDDKEKAALLDLAARLKALPADTTDGELIQGEVYAVGKAHVFEPLRAWFGALYEVLLGASQGPRFGSFAAIYGLPQTVQLIEDGANGKLAG
jgi:lysyl-tRNA synthetase class 1